MNLHQVNSDPRLFGISGHSNRDTGKKSHWGKNEFNSSFPISLLCYMESKGIKPVYIKMDNDRKTYHSTIGVTALFGKSPKAKGIYYSFEDSYVPYQEMVRGQLERSDLVTISLSGKSKKWLKCFEIKLTALPDNSTFHLKDDTKYACELVFRPTAIEHLALSIATPFKDSKKDLLKTLTPVCSRIFNWRSKSDNLTLLPDLVSTLNELLTKSIDRQEPFVLQPIWKSEGRRSVLAENCLDVFVWSNYAFTRLFLNDPDAKAPRMTREKRSVFWLMRMLYDFAQTGMIQPGLITSEMAYEVKNDKAFAVSGKRTWKYLKCDALTNPRIKLTEIPQIILGDGLLKLSPERRFDAAVVNSLTDTNMKGSK